MAGVTSSPPPQVQDMMAGQSSLMKEQFNQFQEILEDMKLPTTLDRRDRPRDGSQYDTSIVALSEYDEVLNIFFEGCVGSRKCPECFVLCMSMSWLSHQPSTSRKGLYTLYVHQGITADKGGQTYLDKFNPPRKVTYFINHMLSTTSSGRRSEGEVLARTWNLETPCSSSIPLNYRVDNKLLTTLFCAASGQMYPATLGFWLAGTTNGREYREMPDVTLVKMDSAHINPDLVHAKVKEFLHSRGMQEFDQVVVKPFGPAWNSCKGVTYHSKEDFESIVMAALDLLSLIAPGMGILLQAFIYTLQPIVPFDLGLHAINTERKQLAFRVRAIVARTANNKARMTQLVVGINDVHIPIGGVSTQPVSLDMTLRLWGMTDPNLRRDIHRVMRNTSEKLMLELLRQESELTVEERGGFACQTDMVGMDFILTKCNDVITPVLIEVNAHDCLYQCTVFEVLNPHMLGYASSAYLQIMLARSQRYQLYDKTVLVIGSGGYRSRNLFVDAKALGVKILLVDAAADCTAQKQVFRFFQLDIVDHTHDEEHAAEITHILQEALPAIQIDGCLTFSEDCVPLAAMVAEQLELHHLPSVEAACNAKSKFLTQEVLRTITFEPSHRPPIRLYASPAIRVAGVHDLDSAVKQVPLPAMIKMEHSSNAIGVRLVSDIEEAVEHLEQLQGLPQTRNGTGKVEGPDGGQPFVLTKRLLGTEHDVDVVMYKGELMSAFISDNGPTRGSTCVDTTASLPTVLPPELRQQLLSGAQYCCRQLGLHTGVFNVEMMMTPRGARLIEINACLGGSYQREWIRYLYKVDLLESALLCACGIRPHPTGLSSLPNSYPATVDEHLMGLTLYSSRHHQALSNLATPHHLQAMHDSDVILYSQLQEEVANTDQPYEKPFACLGVKAGNLEEAKAKLTALCISLGLETEEELRTVLGDFVESL